MFPNPTYRAGVLPEDQCHGRDLCQGRELVIADTKLASKDITGGAQEPGVGVLCRSRWGFGDGGDLSA